MLKKYSKSIITSFIGLAIVAPLNAQINRPAVGGWNTYLPYRNVIDFTTKDNNEFYCISTSSFFVFDNNESYLERYSKANGMNDVGMSFIAYDELTQKTVLVYQNGNIDLFSNGIFENIPDIKVSTISGDKTINAIFTYNGKAYLSSNIGLIVLNISKKQIDEVIPFYSGTSMGLANAASVKNNEIYVATNIGLFKTNLNNPHILNYATWEKLSAIELTQVTHSGNNIFVSNTEDAFIVNGNTIQAIKSTTNPIIKINESIDGNLWLMTKETSLSPYAVKIAPNGNLIDSIPNFYSLKMLDENDGYYWSCDSYHGLRRRNSTNANEEWANISPSGPYSNGAQKVWAKNGEIWLAHGTKQPNSWLINRNKDAFSRLSNNTWRDFVWDVIGKTPSNLQYYQTDAITVAKDETNNIAYIGYLNGGVVAVDKNDSLTIYKNGYLELNTQGDLPSFRVTSMLMDATNNLWITQSFVNNALTVKTAEGNWLHYNLNGNNHAAALAIDEYNQKWMAVGNTGNGIMILNDNGTLGNPGDDVKVSLRKGANSGNLPDNKVNVIAKDLDGAMWVGTESGIGIFSCIGDIRQSNICDADLRPLKTEGFNFANYMFENIAVKAIAVDAGNRKWIGTTVGLFLLSADGENIIEQFYENNSPLLSNVINNIDIDPITGVVYISTEKGLCSFGGEALEAGPEVTKPLFVYPNPVPSGYQGIISIKGMVANSNVKITDINGQLVYQGTSTGGQFSWNGKDYKGRKVQSGVYLAFVVGKDNSNKATGKFIIHE